MSTTNKKILIFGGAGMLGKSFYDLLHESNLLFIYDKDCNEPWVNYCDVRDHSSVRNLISSINPDIVINLAAMTDLEECETYPIDALNTNALSVKNMVSCLSGCVFIHISTAGVFDGIKNEYTEYDIPNPINIYGYSKYLGEIFALQYSSAYVFRAGWMMGNINKDKKFVKKFLSKAKISNSIMVVTDKYGTPTYTKSFSKTIMDYVNLKIPFGLYHNVGNGECNRFDVATKIVENLKLNVTVIPCNSDYYINEYFANRPKSEILLNKKLIDLGLNLMNTWDEDLKNYCKEIK